ncbi:hypothetical protein IP86_10970 [Rhodopseudomonas sp. AAP120]|uniref:hypothetical protein n=1 Tax=Rhodopseudomonas sp. AAP120 TaxID=1523430 RepID=UPI0006B888C1|nr:hypothetical protein [Rhodopseudomonas sp. AAP120]KPF98833.1 hypothetical protein IP86_10970 [Rhodopseudomonas sp. AAP120]
MDTDEDDPVFQAKQTDALWITCMLMSEAVLVELLRARGGGGKWFDKLRADIIKQTKNISHEGLSIDQELKIVPRTVRLVNGIFDGALKALDRDGTV